MERQFQVVEKRFKQTQQQRQETSELIDQKTHIIHIFDRGDIAEVFDQLRQMERITDGMSKNITKFSNLEGMLKVTDLLLPVWKHCWVF